MSDDNKANDAENSSAQPANETFSDMVSLGPPPVPQGFDDSNWHQDAREAKHSEELSHLVGSDSVRYERRGELGHGGMATIFDSVDFTLRRHVAVKVIHQRQATKEASDDERSPLQRFIDEAQITAQLEHPNIVPVHEIGIDDEGNAYFTMKRVEGRSLRDIFDDLRAGKEKVLEHYNEHTCLDVLLKVCEAIAFAHSRNVIHRDLKPDNIMVGRFGEVQVMDWGLAKLIGPNIPVGSEDAKPTDTFTANVSVHSQDAQRTIEGTISGTPAYMSPEQARGEVSKIDERSDVFLLGTLLYEMLTMVPPFHAESSIAALRRAQQHELLSVADMGARLEANPELEDETIVHPRAIARAKSASRELAAIAEHALSHRAEDRYQNVEAMIADIERYRRGQAISVLTDSPLRAFGKWFSRHRLFTFTASAGLVVALLSSMVILLMDRAHSREQLADKDKIIAFEARERELQQQRDREAQEARDKERREARERDAETTAQLEAVTRRSKARGFLDQANDKLARAADTSDDRLRRVLRFSAINLLDFAIDQDQSFGLPLIVRGQTHLQLGFLQRALDDLIEGTRIEQSNEPYREDPAVLMTIAMIALSEGKILGHQNWQEVYERALERIRPRRESDAAYFQLSKLLLEANDATKRLEGDLSIHETIEEIQRISALTTQISELQSREHGLWEVHLFAGVLRMYEAQLAIEKDKSKTLLNAAVTDFKRARTLRRQLPIVVHFLTQAQRELQTLEDKALSPTRSTFWDKYIEEFPDDPIGYLARARLPIEDLERGVVSPWEEPKRLKTASDDNARALLLHPDFTEAIDNAGLLYELQGNYESALGRYSLAFSGYNPMLDRVPPHFSAHPASMSLLERYIRMAVRVDSMQGITINTLRALDDVAERCAPENISNQDWNGSTHPQELKQYGLSVALDESIKRGLYPAIQKISARSQAYRDDEHALLEIARALMYSGEFSAAKDFLGGVFSANQDRLALEAEIERIERAANGEYVELDPVERLFTNRIVRQRSGSRVGDNHEFVSAVVGASRLANLEELQASIDSLLTDMKGTATKALERDLADQVARLFSWLTIEAPDVAKAQIQAKPSLSKAISLASSQLGS